VALVIAGGMVWALGQVLTRKFSRDSGQVMLRAISLHAIPQLVITSLLLERGQWQAILTATPFIWLAVGIFTFVGFFCAYSLWYTLLTRNRVDELMPFVLLMPVVGVISAAIALGEPITAANLGGGAVILLGVGVVTGIKLPRFSWFASKQARG
jgi:O-acetylserine/cysteine efflux transporter